jgi:hypothetical protein
LPRAVTGDRGPTVSVKLKTSLNRSTAELRHAEAVQPAAESRELELRHPSFWTRARLVADLTFLTLAAVVADLSSPAVNELAGKVLWPALFVAIVLYLSYLRGSYRRRVKLDSLDDLRATGSVLAIATSVVDTLRVLLENGPKTAAGHSVRHCVFSAVSVDCGLVDVN